MKLIEWRGVGGVAAVAIPGIPQDPEILFQAVPGGGRCGVVHLPGYGANREVPGPHDFAEIRRALEREIGDEPVVLVGFSGGGFRALQLAIAGRLNLKAMVLLAPAAGCETQAERDAYRGLAAGARAGIDLVDVVRTTSLTQAEAADPRAAAVFARAEATSRENLALELEAYTNEEPVFGRLGAVDVPVDLLVGDEDLATPPVISERLAAELPRARLQKVPAAGHALITFHGDLVRGVVGDAIQAARPVR